MTNFLLINPTNTRRKRQAVTLLIDNVIVMDGSGSVGDCEFRRGKVAIKNLMKSANAVAVEKRYDEKYAAVTFSSSASVNFKFLPYSTAERRLSMINFPSGATNTQAGLAEARNLFLESLTGTLNVSLSLSARQPGRVLNRLNARQSERVFESLRNSFPLALGCVVSSARIFIIFFSYTCLWCMFKKDNHFSDHTIVQ